MSPEQIDTLLVKSGGQGTKLSILSADLQGLLKKSSLWLDVAAWKSNLWPQEYKIDDLATLPWRSVTLPVEPWEAAALDINESLTTAQRALTLLPSLNTGRNNLSVYFIMLCLCPMQVSLGLWLLLRTLLVRLTWMLFLAEADWDFPMSFHSPDNIHYCVSSLIKSGHSVPSMNHHSIRDTNYPLNI